MQYAIIGAGGTGGVVGYFMTKAGKDVTLIARGRHLEAMKEHGLTLERLWDPNPETIAVKATDMGHYKEQPDVILVCVKGYSLEDTVPFIRRVAKPDTIVIPILNIYGTGAKLQKELPELLVTDGCIYVSANIKEPGVLLQHGKILRIVFGVREKTDWRPELEQIRQDFTDSAIDGILSENIRREALEKFSYVSPIGAAGLYCNAVAGDFQEEGAPRELFCSMIREIAALADAMGVPFQKDMVDVNLHILSNLAPETTTSMQRDVMAGKPSEIDGLVYEVVRMGKLYGVPVPSYTKVVNRLAEKKGIIFDMDGVLVNTEPLHFRCWQEVLKEDGITLDYEIYKPCIGSTREVFRQLMVDAYGDIFEDYPTMNRRMEEKKKEIVEKEGFPQCEGIREVLEKLHQEGYLLAVGSSSPEDVIQKVLKDLDLAQYFSAFISGENMAHPKPAPDTFLAAAEALLLDPSACMVVEDSTNGGKAATAAGMSCVWFHNPDSGDQQIPDAVLEISSWDPSSAEKIMKASEQ